MPALLRNTWTVFSGLLLGLFLLMVSLRPELQSRPGREGPAQTIAIVGHALTWTTGTVLSYRMVRKVREHGIVEEVGGNKPPPE